MPKVVEAGLVASTVLSMNLCDLTQAVEDLFGQLNTQPSARVGHKEGRIFVLRMAQTTSRGSVAFKDESEVTADRHEPVLVELAESNVEHPVHQIHIRHDEPECLSDPQARAIQSEQQRLHRVRLKASRPQMAHGLGQT